MKFAIIYEQDPETGAWGASSPDVPGCYAFGKSLPAVKRRMKSALEFHLESLREDGKTIMPPRHRVGSISLLDAV